METIVSGDNETVLFIWDKKDNSSKCRNIVIINQFTRGYRIEPFSCEASFLQSLVCPIWLYFVSWYKPNAVAQFCSPYKHARI